MINLAIPSIFTFTCPCSANLLTFPFPSHLSPSSSLASLAPLPSSSSLPSAPSVLP